jgi:plasmid stabilization system protein ParE
MPYPVLVPAAEADIEEALFNTLTKWGQLKYEQYAALIQEGLESLAENPRLGHPTAFASNVRTAVGATWGPRRTKGEAGPPASVCR